MREFFNVLPPSEALKALLRHLDVQPRSDTAPLTDCLGRVAARDFAAREPLPPFARSTMDGYSVRARDTFGATESLPALLDVVGEVPMGKTPNVSLDVGEAAVAYTGGMLAGEADAVVMVENTQRVGESTIEALRPVAPGENVIRAGEDMQAGAIAVPKGRLIRPQDVGLLAAIGMTKIEVARRPRVAIVSTGDEITPPSSALLPGQIRDVNTYALASLVREAGGEPVLSALVGDDYAAQRSAAIQALERADILVFSAGSSVSSRDLTAQVLDKLGEPGILAHGIAHKPGKPTIVALVNGVPAFGLPGNPVSAMIVFGILVKPIIHAMIGLAEPGGARSARARLTRDIPSAPGREEHVQARLLERNGELLAEPLFGKSGLIGVMAAADGVVVVPLNDGGLYEGDEVDVGLY